jgi:hypothetical protein
VLYTGILFFMDGLIVNLNSINPKHFCVNELMEYKWHPELLIIRKRNFSLRKSRPVETAMPENSGDWIIS